MAFQGAAADVQVADNQDVTVRKGDLMEILSTPKLLATERTRRVSG